MPPVLEVEQAYLAARADPTFKPELDTHLKHYIGPPRTVVADIHPPDLLGCKVLATTNSPISWPIWRPTSVELR